jgi:tripartite-type tricarboxylate transporter receptor subunit TctC
MNRDFLYCAFLTLVLALPSGAGAQTFPTAPVSIVVTTPPGGSIDAVARVIASDLGPALGQPVLVVNRGGAGGNIAAEFVAKSRADGHTLLMTASSTLTMNAFIYPSLPFDPETSFVPITIPARNNNILVVHPKLNVSTLNELVALLKAQPGKLNYASGGNGSFSHLAPVLFNTHTGTSATHVPYSGIAPAMTALLSGQVDYMFDSATSIPHIRAGKLKALAVTGPRRLAALPEIATLRELGLPAMEVARSYYGILAPAGTPAEVVQRLNREIVRIMGQASTADKLTTMGLESATSTPEELAANLREDLKRFGPIARQAGMKAQ